jgi:RHS repeat-associated protein
VGNVYRSTDHTDRVYGHGGRLAEAGGVRYLHDEDGQLVEKVLPDGRTWRYTWDLAGQLVEVTRPDGQKVSFAYDALGRRVRKTFVGKATRYVWDGDNLVHEVKDEAAAVTWVFEPGTFAPLAKAEGERRFGVLTDHLGTPRMMADEAGALAWKAQLDVYGVAYTDVALTACPWRWPGQYEDEETGLYYNRFRYYDPETGRYVSQDPIGLAGGLALYGYVWDPLGESDPYGLTCYRAKRTPGGLDVGEEITEREAIDRLRRAGEHGADVFSDLKSQARRLAKKAGHGLPIEDPPHGEGYSPHFHVKDRATKGHSYFPKGD